MRWLIVVILLVLGFVPGVTSALDLLGCDAWLETGNVLVWAACRVAGWLAFNADVGLWLTEAGQGNPL